VTNQPNKAIHGNEYLDLDFIDNLYFKNDQLKDSYINSIKSVLNDNILTGEISRVKVSEYITNNNSDIPFLMDAIKFDEFNGNSKVVRYYTALGICRYNINAKIENNYYEFLFEETLALNTLQSDNRNYARLEILFILGDAFLKANDFAKMNYYFGIISSDKYDLSGVTISNFHRLIGDIYLRNDNKNEALKWYRSGLQLNSKLGVKKLVKTLEEE
jgi:hypothetical protein